MVKYETPKVTIIAATERSPVYAAALLIFTKSTRLKMSGEGLQEIRNRCLMDDKWMMEELGYMAKTIRSSWEFLDVTFMVENVSRACAQQITRTRQASYAMQSQRVTDMSNATFTAPAGDYEGSILLEDFGDSLGASMNEYKALVDNGLSLEDARGVLPMNIQCNLVDKYNLRTLVDLIHARKSYRAQGEYRTVAMQMEAELINMWPWVTLFLAPRAATAGALLHELRDLLSGIETMDAADFHKANILIAKVQDALEAS